MNMPLDIAVDIGRIVSETRAARIPLDLSCCVDELLIRFPESGVQRMDVLDALKQEAAALGLTLN